LANSTQLLFEQVGRQHPIVLFVVGLLGVALVATADYLTGYDPALGFFYLLPVAFVAWFVGERAGIAISCIGALAWHVANMQDSAVSVRSIVFYWNSTTRLGFFLVVALLLSKLKNALERESALSRTDFLTGALNSRAFSEAGMVEILRARRHGRPFTTVYIDLDNFKVVNDTLGHSVGNTLLRHVVDALKSTVRATDLIARLGGDEFAVLLPETDGESAKVLVSKLREHLLDAMQNQTWPVTFSVGVLTCVSPPATVDELIRVADVLMYDAKKTGKNAIRYSTYPS
jgi:diguanylate cyclase (GGDEF)-like protein